MHYGFRSKFTLSLIPLLVFVLVNTSSTLYQVANAYSSFIRQEVMDNGDDWYYYDYSNTLGKSQPYNESYIRSLTGSNIGNIRSVTYSGNDSMLIATLWLYCHQIQYRISPFRLVVLLRVLLLQNIIPPMECLLMLIPITKLELLA